MDSDFSLHEYIAECLKCGQHIKCSKGIDETPNGMLVPDMLYYTLEGEDIDNCPKCKVDLYQYPPQRKH